MAAEVIMIASGKGGTGKSTVAVLLGAALAERGQRVLLMELVGGIRSVDHIAGLGGRVVYDAGDVLSGRCDAGKAVVESPLYHDLFVIASPYSLGSIRPRTLRVFTERVGPVFDTILLDMPSGFGAAACAADRALLVATPDPVCIRAAQSMNDLLMQNGVAETRLLINQTPRSLDDCGVGSLDECIDAVGAQLLGVIPQSAAIRRTALTGVPLERLSREWRVMRAVAARLCGDAVPLIIR